MNTNPIREAVFQSWRLHVVATACRLGIFSHLAQRAQTADELAQKVACVPHMLGALLDACVGCGLLVRSGNGYRASHLSCAYLVPGRPLYLGHVIEMQARGASRWALLTEAVQHGRVPEVDDSVGEQAPLFTLAMNDLGAHDEAFALASAVDLSGAHTLLDIGCGSGLYAIELCRHNPDLTALLVDREDVLKTTRELVAASGLEARIGLRAGDMTAGPLALTADAVLLSDALYYDAATTREVLASVHGMLTPGGRLIIRGYHPDPGASESAFGALFRLQLLLSDPTRNPPTRSDLLRWLEAAGFANARAYALTERSTCFEAQRGESEPGPRAHRRAPATVNR